MSGGAIEYVAGYMSNVSNQSGFTSDELTIYSKYLDVYSTNSTINSYNDRILGDATGELGPFYYYVDKDGTKRFHNSWYGDYSEFLAFSGPWFSRSGPYSNGVLAGQFYFVKKPGGVSTYDGFRLALTPKI